MFKALGNKLLQLKLIEQEQLSSALATQHKTDEHLLQIIVDSGFCTEDEVVARLSENMSIEVVSNPLEELDEDVARSVSQHIARKGMLVPYKLEGDVLFVAVSNPTDFPSLQNVKVLTGKAVEIRLTSLSNIKSLLAKVYSESDVNVVLSADEKTELTDEEIEEINLINRVDSAPLVRMVNSIINDAFQKNASDIHIEPEETSTRIRFRVDGGLFVYKVLPKELHDKVVTRIKIMANIDVSNKQIPHDGSFKFKSQYLSVDLRVSTLPTPTGEKVVMRLLGADKNVTYDLYSLGLSDYTISMIEKTIRLPNGIFLVTGPTGSGKTTTLYSILHLLAKGDNSVVTVEDPVERNFPGITQVQINNKAGLNFSGALRSILRQDPDTIMIGEMRDGETAEIATRSAITGHFVLSTIHTNDALSTISRLVDMGVEPYMVSSALKCVIAQRLVRKICPHCKAPHKNTETEKSLIDIDFDDSMKGTGCDKCNHIGYSGRTAVFEIILIDRGLQRLITESASMDEMKAYIEEQGIRTMREEVMDLVKEGTTTVEEAVKILYSTD